jgi:diguanylate cyclase (GGDEF)-like protein/PAS domain S-box-containing protein
MTADPGPTMPSERRLRAGFMTSPIGLARVSFEGKVMMTNPAWLSIVGWSEADLLVGGVGLPTHPDERESSMAVMADLTNGTIDTWTGERRYVRPNGTVVHTVATATVVPGDDGQPDFVLSQLIDNTAAKQAEFQLAASERQLRTVFDASPIGMGTVRADGRFVTVNDALCALIGIERNLLVGSSSHVLFPPEERSVAGNVFEAVTAGTTPIAVIETTFMRADGVRRRGTIHLAHLAQFDGSAQVLVQLVDVTERFQFEQQLQHQADHDPLTGLMNRRAFTRALEHHCARVARVGPVGALLMIDLDNFKYINDRFGHHIGDEVIASVSAVLRQRLRESDLLARLGGDEFAVLLTDSAPLDAQVLADALVEAVRGCTVRFNDSHDRRVTASIGIASFSDERPEPSDVMAAADMAMYDAKDAGRNCWVNSDDEFPERQHTRRRMSWIERIERALANDGFVLFGQPIVNLAHEATDYCELLLRMKQDDGSLMSPTRFLYVAERVGLAPQIDRWVARRAIEIATQLPTTDLSVNLSARTLADPTFTTELRALFMTYGVDPRRLTFEITETAAVANMADARRFAFDLADLGCRLALDDFGAGFGSFYYLKYLPFDLLKIDGEFVEQIATSTIDQTIVSSLVSVATKLGKRTVGEYAHNQQTVDMLRFLGVDYAQGYHLGKPFPIDTLLD